MGGTIWTAFEGLPDSPICRRKTPRTELSEHGQYATRVDFKVTKDAQLVGYLQSFRYFEGIEDRLRKELEWSVDARVAAESLLRPLWGDSDAPLVGMYIPRRSELEEDDLHYARTPRDGFFERAIDVAKVSLPGAKFVVICADPIQCKRTLC